MSCILTLASAAIIAGLSMSTATSLAALSNFSEGKENIEEGIETMFADGANTFADLTRVWVLCGNRFGKRICRADQLRAVAL